MSPNQLGIIVIGQAQIIELRSQILRFLLLPTAIGIVSNILNVLRNLLWQFKFIVAVCGFQRVFCFIYLDYMHSTGPLIWQKNVHVFDRV